MTNDPMNPNDPQRPPSTRRPGARRFGAGLIGLVALGVALFAWFWMMRQPPEAASGCRKASSQPPWSRRSLRCWRNGAA
jgi:hypothetical protein